MVAERERARAYARETGDDPADIRDWAWPSDAGRPRCGSSSSTRARARSRSSSSSCPAASRWRSLERRTRRRREPGGRSAGRGRGGPGGARPSVGWRRARSMRSATASSMAATRSPARRRRRRGRGGDRRRSPTSRRSTTRVAADDDPGRPGGAPGRPHVACFDTAFHATLPRRRYPLRGAGAAGPRTWGVRRYGFHGLSVEWSRRAGRRSCSSRPPAELRLVVAHLGSGCSVTAVDGGRSVETSMGMTPLEGLVMGTRAGSLDPGILLALLRDGRRTAEELAEDLDHRSGLLGLSGSTRDVRVLLAAEAAGDDAGAARAGGVRPARRRGDRRRGDGPAGARCRRLHGRDRRARRRRSGRGSRPGSPSWAWRAAG